MPELVYKGRADRREFSAADLKKLGVEGGKKTTFNRGEAVEVDAAVAETLMERYPKDFAEPEDAPREMAAAEDDEDVMTDEDVTADGGRRSTSDGTGGPSGTASTAGSTTTGGSTRTSGSRRTRGGGSTGTTV